MSKTAEEKVQGAATELAQQKAELMSVRWDAWWFTKEFTSAEKKGKEAKAWATAFEHELFEVRALVDEGEKRATKPERRAAELEERLAKAKRCNAVIEERWKRQCRHI